MPSTSTSMSAQRCFTAWKLPIGLSNCTRSFAYSTDRSSSRCPPPSSSAAVYYAAWCIAASHPDASVAASTTKAWCSDASKRVAASALQVHGGIGFTWEHDVHLFLKRAQLDQLAFGDAVVHRTRLTSLLRHRIEAGESVL